MELGHLKAFLAVADLGSITRASQTLHLSQPAVSAQIKKLEDDLGVALFHRAARGMTLTSAGERLVPSAREVLTRADAFQTLAARLAGRTMGVLRVGVIDCGYDLALPRIITGLTQQHADVHVELRTSTSGANLRALADHELDAAIVEGVVDGSRWHKVRLGTSRVGIVAPAAWLARLEVASLPDLTDLPWVGRPPGCSYWAVFDELCAKHGLSTVSYQVTDTASHACALVAAGAGLALADLADAEAYLASGEVVVWPDLAFEVPVWWVTLASRKDEPLLSAFEQQVRANHSGTLRYARSR